LRVTVSDDRGMPLRAGGLAAWLRRVAPARARGRVHIALLSDERMRTLNAQFRGKDHVTDVLSFPTHLIPKMRRVEQRLRRAGGLPDGLIERTGR
jgi:ssRNA-specific RNase YbeY (16S rRNA maturation enzyme)